MAMRCGTLITGRAVIEKNKQKFPSETSKVYMFGTLRLRMTASPIGVFALTLQLNVRKRSKGRLASGGLVWYPNSKQFNQYCYEQLSPSEIEYGQSEKTNTRTNKTQ